MRQANNQTLGIGNCELIAGWPKMNGVSRETVERALAWLTDVRGDRETLKTRIQAARAELAEALEQAE